jgi:hypothetical protein
MLDPALEAAQIENRLDQILISAYPAASGYAHATSWLGWIAGRMGTRSSRRGPGTFGGGTYGWMSQRHRRLMSTIADGFILMFSIRMICGRPSARLANAWRDTVHGLWWGYQRRSWWESSHRPRAPRGDVHTASTVGLSIRAGFRRAGLVT